MDAGPAAGPEGSPQKSTTDNIYLTRGYLDPSVIEGGEYCAATDGWALGITMLVALTGRSPLSIINKCEEVRPPPRSPCASACVLPHTTLCLCSS
mmetsp:Transcript_35316/g.103490  ORF Transcript_35316/g.103490 Transcript_35316/m.103490 type:complete len:95 (-) Transcript_35316:877-1161(-)